MFVIFENFREKKVLILLGNIARCLKFELISWKTGLEHDTRELLCCLACDCNYCEEKLCDVSKVDCIARECILFSKLLEVSKVFLSFTYIF